MALRLSAHIAAYPPVPAELPWKVPGGKPITARLLFTDPGGAALHRSSFNAVAWQPGPAGSWHPAGPRERHARIAALLRQPPSLANGVGIRALAAYLGHSDPGFTLRIYTHLMPAADDRMRAAVDAVFAASDGPATAQAVRR